MSEGEDKLGPWRWFLTVKWEEYKDEEDFPERRKKVAEEWKNLSDDERKQYLDPQKWGAAMFTDETLDPSENCFKAELVVFRTFYSDEDLDDEPETDWWENLKYVMIYDNNEPWYDTEWPGDNYIQWYENRDHLDGVSPETFVQKAIVDRYDLFNMQYDAKGNTDMRDLTILLADKTTAETGMLRMVDIEGGSDPKVIADYRGPADWMNQFLVKLVGRSHSVEQFAEESGLDKEGEESEESKKHHVDLRRSLQDIFKEKISLDSQIREQSKTGNADAKGMEPQKAGEAASAAIEEIGRMMEAKELMGE